jgi:thioredoxin-like negative regulator of GroEL
MRKQTAAVELLNRARKVDPEDNQLTLQLADLFYEMGRYREAETHSLLAAYR